MTKVQQMRESREAQVRSTRLKELEATIEGSARAVWNMAEALKEIRDSKLWEDTHDTWGAYCRDRWGIASDWANRTIQALEVREQLATGAPARQLPTHVAQAVELAVVAGEKERAAVWDKAVATSSGKAGPSKLDIRAAVKEHKTATAPEPPKPTRAELAHEAAREVRTAAERFQISVRSLMSHIKHLPEADTEACAYVVVQTVHAVIEILEEAGHIKPSVKRGVLGSTRDRGEILVS